MAREENDIKEQLKSFVDFNAAAGITSAVVTKINENDTVAVRLETGLELNDVRLKSVIKSGGKTVMTPAEGSIVLLGKIAKSHDYVVLAVEEIEKMTSVIDDVEYRLDKNGFLLKKESETMQKLMTDILDAALEERHTTSYGPTISLTPDSQLKYNQLKTRVKNFFQNA